MADLATQLIRITARTFYTVEQALVIDALVIHSTLSDIDLASVLNINSKTLRKHCGRLKEDGLLSIQTRAERRLDQVPSFHGNNPQTGKERLTNREWYYLNFHRAIDSIKYRMHKLNKQIDSLGMPTTEKKDLTCPRCKSQYTELEVLDNLDLSTGQFLCHKCRHPLDPVEEEERANENESMRRLNQQFEKIQSLMQKIDAAAVPENDFETALSKQKEIPRTDANPGAKTEIVEPKKHLQSTKGLELKPEKIAVQVQDDEDVKRETAAAEAEARRAKEARANALPEWISRSTITQDITAVGAKEEKERQEREAHTGVAKEEDGEEKKPSVDNDDVMAAYWKELAAAREKEAQEAQEEDDEDDDDDDDEFEDVDVSGGGNTPANGGVNGTAATSTGMNTPLNAESSNATDDERETKRRRIDEPSSSNAANGANGLTEKASEDTPAASDADDDELEFQDV